jgi:hypothetical protein
MRAASAELLSEYRTTRAGDQPAVSISFREILRRRLAPLALGHEKFAVTIQ